MPPDFAISPTEDIESVYMDIEANLVGNPSATVSTRRCTMTSDCSSPRGMVDPSNGVTLHLAISNLEDGSPTVLAQTTYSTAHIAWSDASQNPTNLGDPVADSGLTDLGNLTSSWHSSSLNHIPHFFFSSTQMTLSHPLATPEE